MRRTNHKTVILALATAGVAQAAMGATATWNGNADTFWANTNWTSGANTAYQALANDALFFDATAPTGATLFNNNAAGTAFNGITFNAGALAYTLNGNPALLSGNVLGVN